MKNSTPLISEGNKTHFPQEAKSSFILEKQSNNQGRDNEVTVTDNENFKIGEVNGFTNFNSILHRYALCI